MKVFMLSCVLVLARSLSLIRPPPYLKGDCARWSSAIRSSANNSNKSPQDQQEIQQDNLPFQYLDNVSDTINILHESDAVSSYQRAQLLNEQLIQLTTIDPGRLGNAVKHALLNPTEGYYNTEFGTSALKTYRTYVYPKDSQKQQTQYPPVVAAMRTARQIDFLVKRHKSHQLEWVRHHDTNPVTTAVDNSMVEKKRTFPLILLLDNLRSANNVGSIFRTADACGCAQVITAGITPHPYGSGWQKVSKTSLGADAAVSTQHFTTTQQALSSLREANKNVFIVGLETTFKSVDYTRVPYPNFSSEENKTGVLVIVLGNEVTGIDTDLMPLMDVLVQIPMFGSKNSLNVAACAPVVLYEILRQWGVME